MTPSTPIPTIRDIRGTTSRRARLTGVPLLILALAGGAVALPAAGPAVASDQALSAAVTSPAATGTSAVSRFIVRGTAPALDSVRSAVGTSGGRVTGEAAELGELVVDVTGATAQRLRELPGVVGVTADAHVRMSSLGFDPATQWGSLTNTVKNIDANYLWNKGDTGKGVDVAVIDTGVAPIPALKDSGKVVMGPDLSFESQVPGLQYLDTYGHGTAMAGIIAGREGGARTGAQYAADTTNYLGVAPDARIVSVKVGDHNGAVDVSQVIAAINWVVQNRRADGMNIRVLNLSFGTEPLQDESVDPLAYATEQAWRAGIFVVASAGNDGGSVAGLNSPAYDPMIMAVGAVDQNNTVSELDDVVPTFSAKSGGPWGTRAVDLVAPGAKVISPGVSGSLIYSSYSGARIGNGFIRGSGTSQAAAMVSGAAALLLQANPSWTPNRLKTAMVQSSTNPFLDAKAFGAGTLDLYAADIWRWSDVAVPAGGSGLGTLEKGRGPVHVSMDGVTLSGEKDIMGGAWTGSTFAAKTASQTSWTSDGQFNGNYWIGSGFTTSSLANGAWTGRTWSGRTWSGNAWSGRTWSGRTWSGGSWSGGGWSSATWSTDVKPTGWETALWSCGGWQ